MKKTYKVEFTVDDDIPSPSEAKDIIAPFKNSKQFKSWLFRKLVSTYADVINLREVNTANYIKVRVVQVENDQ